MSLFKETTSYLKYRQLHCSLVTSARKSQHPFLYIYFLATLVNQCLHMNVVMKSTLLNITEETAEGREVAENIFQTGLCLMDFALHVSGLGVLIKPYRYWIWSVAR